MFVFSGVDVTSDHAGCPPYICGACQKKLVRSTKIKNRDVRGGVVNYSVPEFPHPQQQNGEEALRTQ